LVFIREIKTYLKGGGFVEIAGVVGMGAYRTTIRLTQTVGNLAKQGRFMNTMRTHRRLVAGFTLLELMIVVAIIAILTAIALPTYNTYITRAKLTDAQNNLSATRVLMEQFFQDNRQYGPVGGGGGCGPSMPPASVNWVYECGLTTVNGAPGYTLSADGQGGTAVAGFAFQLDQANNRSTSRVPNASWYAPTPANCWVTNKGVCQ
jgi:type IV pilus assembly protein PilE